MNYIRYEGPWNDVAKGRHNLVSSHRLGTDDLTVAYFEQCGPDCTYPVKNHSGLRPGEEGITKAKYESIAATIKTHNDLVVAREPPAPPDPRIAKIEGMDLSGGDKATLRELFGLGKEYPLSAHQ